MDFYILIAILAYLAFAVNAVIDKFLLKKSIPEPVTYAFYIGVLSGLALVLIPFGVTWPTVQIILIALISGMLFVYALASFFASLKRHEASYVLPALGGLVPLITFSLSFFLVGERLIRQEVWGLIFLVAGTFLIAGRLKFSRGEHSWFFYALLAAFLFALSFTLAKAVYLDQNFISGLVWTRLGLVIGALTILFFPSARQKIFHTTKTVEKPSGALFLTGQALAAGAGVLQNYAVSLGSVTLVNALQGTQFAFLFILTAALSHWFPKVLKEDFALKTVVKKIIAMGIISVGLILIA